MNIQNYNHSLQNEINRFAKEIKKIEDEEVLKNILNMMDTLENCQTFKEYINVYQKLYPEKEQIPVPKRFIKEVESNHQFPEIDESTLRVLKDYDK